MLLAKMPSDLAAQARQLAYRLYSICQRKGWAEHARDYNALVISRGVQGGVSAGAFALRVRNRCLLCGCTTAEAITTNE